MHLLLTDETNLPSDPGAKFFAYGGLLFETAKLPNLDRAIALARREAGYRPGDPLKFDTRSRPAHVTIEAAKEVKRAVVQACIDVEAKFIVCVVLHDIAKNVSIQVLIRRGANTVIGKFNYYLGLCGDHGIVCVDRLPQAGEYSYLTDKFCGGLDLQDDKHVALDRIKLFASTCINASHASSAMDIVLGSFRYCINNPRNREAARDMMGAVTRLIWHERDGDNIMAFERGLVYRPKTVTVEKYQAEYDQLLADINSLLAEEGQE